MARIMIADDIIIDSIEGEWTESAENEPEIPTDEEDLEC